MQIEQSVEVLSAMGNFYVEHIIQNHAYIANNTKIDIEVFLPGEFVKSQ
jgi:hypothetical protein